MAKKHVYLEKTCKDVTYSGMGKRIDKKFISLLEI